MMVLIGGGLVSFWGPVLGALFFILARDLLGAYTETWLLWYGLLFMAMVLWKPDGIAGLWQDWRGAATTARGRDRHGAARRPDDGALRGRGICTSASAARSCWRTSRSRSRRAACRESWARTAPARRRASTC